MDLLLNTLVFLVCAFYTCCGIGVLVLLLVEGLVSPPLQDFEASVLDELLSISNISHSSDSVTLDLQSRVYGYLSFSWPFISFILFFRAY